MPATTPFQAALQYGPIIGSYADKPIFDYVVVEGKVLHFFGLALCRSDGTIDVDHLNEGEFVVPPGLLYCGHHHDVGSLAAKAQLGRIG